MLTGLMVREAWRLAFHYSYELAHPMHGRAAGWYAISIQDHGHVGIVLDLAIALLSTLFAAVLLWRFFTRLPAVILMPDRLWIHPSFGRKPIAYANIVGVSLDRVSKNLIGLNVVTEQPIGRTWLFRAFDRSPCLFCLREAIVDASLYDLARFRNRLASNAEAARKKLHQPVAG